MKNNKTGVYIHIPFCQSRCGYCDFYSLTRCEDDLYIEALCKEIELRSKEVRYVNCDTIYFGGGTPSLLSPKSIGKILSCLKKHFCIEKYAEITMEMNPIDMTEEYLLSIYQLGINRISVGVQTRDNHMLSFLGRNHSSASAAQSIKRAYQIGFHNISIDLMYELPGQTCIDFKNSLLWAVHLPITHLSVYSLIIEKGTRFWQLMERGLLQRPTESESWNMYQAMCRILPHYGFHRYEISSFARKNYESKHNLKYWYMDDYIGFGPSACSRLGTQRIEVVPGIRQYITELLKDRQPPMEIISLSESEDMEEYCFLHLRMKEGFDREDFYSRYGSYPETWYKKEIAILKDKNLLIEKDGHIQMTAKGAALGNFVFEKFLRS